MKVMIVDDEPIIRIGLRTVIEWEKHGLALAREAADGVEALEMMQEEPIDLLITDIRMPRMDGLELIRLARQQRPDIGVVVLSCLDDFSFVKEAMKLGARDYILKPLMEPDELVTILQTIRASLEEERRERARISALNEQLEQTWQYRMQARLNSVLNDGMTDPDLDEELFADGRMYYTIGLFTQAFRLWMPEETESIGIAFSLRMADNGYLLLVHHERGLSTNEWYQRAYSLAESIQSRMTGTDKENARASMVIGVSPPLYDSTELARRWNDHRVQFASYYYGVHSHAIMMQKPDTMVFGDALPLGLRTDLLKAIAGGNDDAILHSMRGMVAALGQAKLDLGRLHAFLYETIGLMIGYARDSGYPDTGELERQYFAMEWISGHLSFVELERSLYDLARELSGVGGGGTAFRDIANPFIRKAVAYIRDQYSCNISTADIASHVKLSRSYLSDLYSREMGESLSETLTRIRIEEACRLLERSDMKIYEIAEEVGFNDSKTFTKTFKRLMGCSPKEYPLSNK